MSERTNTHQKPLLAYVGEDADLISALQAHGGAEVRKFPNGLAFNAFFEQNKDIAIVLCESHLKGLKGDAIEKRTR